MKVVIVGANGKVGKLVAQKLSNSPTHKPTALIRKEEQKAYFDDIGVPVIVESIESQEEAIADAIRGFDAVVFSAGSGAKTGYDKTIEVDLYGAIKVINAAKKNNIRRFVMVGAAFSDVPSFWSGAMRPYYIAKHLADQEVSRSGLDYTILRPVRLTDEEEAGKIMIQSDPNQLEKEIPRVAVAETILQVLDAPSTYGKTLEMSEGNMEIEEAVQQL